MRDDVDICFVAQVFALDTLQNFPRRQQPAGSWTRWIQIQLVYGEVAFVDLEIIRLVFDLVCRCDSPAKLFDGGVLVDLKRIYIVPAPENIVIDCDGLIFRHSTGGGV